MRAVVDKNCADQNDRHGDRDSDSGFTPGRSARNNSSNSSSEGKSS